ncbi:MAG: thioredoxin family protein [Actinobacteria bacterium]|nr:thioredoxin family protein [Actinomycetota bacterium]
MKIQVFGSCCGTEGKKLYALTGQAVKELNINAEIEYITDIMRIVEKGFMQTPVLIIDDNPIVVGYVPDLKTIKNKIAQAGEK